MSSSFVLSALAYAGDYNLAENAVAKWAGFGDRYANQQPYACLAKGSRRERRNRRAAQRKARRANR